MCCGKKRAQVSQADPANQSDEESTTAGAPVYFKYIGLKGLTVIGPISQNRYRFAGPGAVVAVDSRDRYALTGMPTLRRVSELTDVPRPE